MLKIVPQRYLVMFKKYAFLLFIIPLLGPVISYLLTERFGNANIFAYGTVIFVFVILPVLDMIFGKDPVNPDEKEEVPIMDKELYYRFLTYFCVPAYFLLLIWGANIFVNYEFSLAGQIGWVLSIGTVGALGINIAHELVHKDSALEQNLGGILLSMVTYGGFKVEHIRGHHVHVSTPLDASSARFNQSLYPFLANAYVKNFTNAWALEAKKLKRQGKTPFSLHNELILWYGLSLLLCIALGIALGPLGSLFFVAQSFIAFTLLEIVNYLEHYGLHRRLSENGRYERTTPEHSWNSNYFLTNILLFHLQRHSDHHANAKRRYQVLRHHDQAPQLPAGYATMILLALVPPLWKKVMNPRVEKYYQGEHGQLSAQI